MMNIRGLKKLHEIEGGKGKVIQVNSREKEIEKYKKKKNV